MSIFHSSVGFGVYGELGTVVLHDLIGTGPRCPMASCSPCKSRPTSCPPGSAFRPKKYERLLHAAGVLDCPEPCYCPTCILINDKRFVELEVKSRREQLFKDRESECKEEASKRESARVEYYKLRNAKREEIAGPMPLKKNYPADYNGELEYKRAWAEYGKKTDEANKKIELLPEVIAAKKKFDEADIEDTKCNNNKMSAIKKEMVPYREAVKQKLDQQYEKIMREVANQNTRKQEIEAKIQAKTKKDKMIKLAAAAAIGGIAVYLMMER